ncbi:MAG: GGDEF domain-containing protein [Pseudobutyrivibrio sp.]|nr:GGDEF domain-containing protein [Pseudobutyrivibrio sp.]
MLFFRIGKEERKTFYQSKFEYFKKVSAYAAVIMCIMQTGYFVSDCFLYGRFAYETLIPRFSILLYVALFIIVFPKVQTYKGAAFWLYGAAHLSMWCTIWAIMNLVNRDYAREGFIIMHFAFLAVGLAMPLVYHIPIHMGVFLNIIISNLWLHYDSYDQMLALAVPVFLGVILLLFILENSYVDHYQTRKELDKSLVSDKLTGMYNRYKIDEIIDPVTEAFNLNEKVVVLMIDVDHFKNVNDTYGHEAGDRILKYVATKLQSLISEEDYVIRWGGEEFVVLLLDRTISEGMNCARNMRQAVKTGTNDVCPVSISIGLCAYKEGDNFHKAIDQADMALYYAKNHGRDMAVNYEEI